MIQVRLTPTELQLAAFVGIRRRCANLASKRKPAHGADYKDGWDLDIEGAAGEMCVAKWSGKYWYGGEVDRLDEADVGQMDVKTTWRHDGHLVIYEDSPPKQAFVLVTGLAPVYTIRGWTYAKNGQKPEYWRSISPGRAPAFWVPQSALRNMLALPRSAM